MSYLLWQLSDPFSLFLLLNKGHGAKAITIAYQVGHLLCTVADPGPTRVQFLVPGLSGVISEHRSRSNPECHRAWPQNKNKTKTKQNKGYARKSSGSQPHCAKTQTPVAILLHQLSQPCPSRILLFLMLKIKPRASLTCVRSRWEFCFSKNTIIYRELLSFSKVYRVHGFFF